MRFLHAACFATAFVAAPLAVQAGGDNHPMPHHAAPHHANMRHAVRHVAVRHAARPASVSLALDEVHTLTFQSPVATVYVGNPSIADITMIDPRHAFVLGKSYGHTNIVALNHDGNQVFGTYVNVTSNANGGTVTLNRGAQRVTFSCTSNRCDPTPQPGDGKESFDLQNGQNTTHQEFAHHSTGG